MDTNIIVKNETDDILSTQTSQFWPFFDPAMLLVIVVFCFANMDNLWSVCNCNKPFEYSLRVSCGGSEATRLPG